MAAIKRIKVTSKGLVTTSRGRCMAPITYPYLEEVSAIFGMISRDRATVIEILEDGREVTLDEQNFDKNNIIVVEDSVEAVHISTNPVVEDDVKIVEEMDDADTVVIVDADNMDEDTDVVVDADKVAADVDVVEEVIEEVKPAVNQQFQQKNNNKHNQRNNNKPNTQKQISAIDEVVENA